MKEKLDMAIEQQLPRQQPVFIENSRNNGRLETGRTDRPVHSPARKKRKRREKKKGKKK